jgi:hypothetical protein
MWFWKLHLRQYSKSNAMHFLFNFILILVQPTDITRTQYTKCRLRSASWRWASNPRNMWRPLILNKLNKKCITLVLLYWYTMMHGQQSIKLHLRIFPLLPLSEGVMLPAEWCSHTLCTKPSYTLCTVHAILHVCEVCGITKNFSFLWGGSIIVLGNTHGWRVAYRGHSLSLGL